MTHSETNNSEVRVLMSGFQPFLTHATNPTEELMHELKGFKVQGAKIQTAVLPVSYDESYFQLLNIIGEFEPHIIIATGLAADRKSISLERIAINKESSIHPDNDGDIASERKILHGAPDGFFSSLALSSILKSVQELNIPIQVSNSAGTYVCNSLMFKILAYAAEEMKCGFIHIPPTKELSLEKTVEAFKTIIQVSVSNYLD